MKVKELINYLLQFSPDDEVYVEDPHIVYELYRIVEIDKFEEKIVISGDCDPIK